MHKKYLKNNQVYLRSVGSDIYFEKNNVILDKTCPYCKKLILHDKDFCECGFFLKSSKNSNMWSVIIMIWLVIGVFSLIFLTNYNNLEKIFVKKINYSNTSLSPINIQIITSLKTSSYSDYIQNIYVKPREENKLIVLIKPNLWHILSEEDKKSLIEQINETWKNIYKQDHPNLNKKPIIEFANSR